ncbi:unnamed protein product [Ascophyllum nodosum]
MQICDAINQRPDGPSHAAKALKRRLKSDNPKILLLTLTLCETTVKNCSRRLHEALGQRDFMAEVAALCTGHKGFEVRSQALKLIQEWGIAFQNDMSLAYADTYDRLRAQGARFPAVEGGAPVFTPPASSTASTRTIAPHVEGALGGGVKEAPEASPQTMEKLEVDLQMVKDKIILCRQMLPESAGVGKDEALSEVVGFLEACRPRMVDLIEAGIGGGLGEDTFAKCLQINDALLRTLEAEREGTPVDVGDIGDINTDSSKNIEEAAPLLDLEGGKDVVAVAGKMATFSIGDDDDDFAQLRATKPTTATPSGKVGKVPKLGAVPLKTTQEATGLATKPATDDDLDDFLNSLDESPPTGGKGTMRNIDDDDLDEMLG